MRADIGGLAPERRECRPAERLNGTRNLLPGSDGDNKDLFSRAVVPVNANGPFESHREAALALLNGSSRLTRKAGSFLGQLAVDPTPMSDAQADWLATLLERASLPSLREAA